MSNIPVESKENPGFYEIPKYPNYLINLKGQVYSKIRNKILKGKSILLRNVRGDVYSVTRQRLFGLIFSNTEDEILNTGTKIKIKKKLDPKDVKIDSNEDVWAIGKFRKYVTECLYTGHMEFYDSLEELITFLGMKRPIVVQDISVKGYYSFKNVLLVYPKNYRPKVDFKDLYNHWLCARSKPMVI